MTAHAPRLQSTPMENNPYAPPTAPIVPLPDTKAERSGRRWHTNLLLALLTLWSPVTFLALIVVLAKAPKGFLGFVDYYVFLSVPILIGIGAYLLFIRSKYRPLPFLALPVLYFLGAVRLHPELSPRHWQLNASYLSQFPLSYSLCAGFFAACAVYCFVLNKQEGSEDR